jgi:hypothetical protein
LRFDLGFRPPSRPKTDKHQPLRFLLFLALREAMINSMITSYSMINVMIAGCGSEG